MKYFFDAYNFTSAGAIGALVQGLVAKEAWRRGWPSKLTGARISLHFTAQQSYIPTSARETSTNWMPDQHGKQPEGLYSPFVGCQAAPPV